MARSSKASGRDFPPCLPEIRTQVGTMKNLSFPGLPRVLIVDDEDGV